MNTHLSHWLPALDWLRTYNRRILVDDLIAAIIVTLVLIPQALAYALLAGLPPQTGLYAAMLPLVAYALLGSSRTLAIGPVAVVSLMTATAVTEAVRAHHVDATQAAVVIAMLSGLLLLAMGLLRFGFLANFLSHPVVSGFITASGTIIGLSQLRHILGVDGGGDTLPVLIAGLMRHLPDTNLATLAIGCVALLMLTWVRKGLKPLLLRFGISSDLATTVAKTGPVLIIVATTAVSYVLHLETLGVALVGAVPRGLPQLSLPGFDRELWSDLLLSALLISIIGYVESVSMGKTLAAKRRQRIAPNQELIALGAANIASSVSGGFPVTAGFSRSVVNFDAGAQTPAAGVFTAGGVALAALFLTPALVFLPKATLAATIIVSVSQLLDFKLLLRSWHYSKSDFMALFTTISVTLLLGIELGVLGGIVVSVALHLYKTSRPHIAVVGAVAGTEHFRNVQRHNVITQANLVSIRVDESLYFANASYLEDYIYRLIADNKALEHVIIQCTAINEIDISALEALEAINHRLGESGLTLNLSEVKGPVMDALRQADFPAHLSGRIFLTHHQAVEALKTEEIEPYII